MHTPTPTPNSWYLSRNGKRIGPITEPEVLKAIKGMKIIQNDLIWSEGMEGWVEISKVPQFSNQFIRNTKLPPPPPRKIVNQKSATPESMKEKPGSLWSQKKIFITSSLVTAFIAILSIVGLFYNFNRKVEKDNNFQTAEKYEPIFKENTVINKDPKPADEKKPSVLEQNKILLPKEVFVEKEKLDIIRELMSYTKWSEKDLEKMKSISTWEKTFVSHETVIGGARELYRVDLYNFYIGNKVYSARCGQGAKISVMFSGIVLQGFEFKFDVEYKKLPPPVTFTSSLEDFKVEVGRLDNIFDSLRSNSALSLNDQLKNSENVNRRVYELAKLTLDAQNKERQEEERKRREQKEFTELKEKIDSLTNEQVELDNQYRQNLLILQNANAALKTIPPPNGINKKKLNDKIDELTIANEIIKSKFDANKAILPGLIKKYKDSPLNYPGNNGFVPNGF